VSRQHFATLRILKTIFALHLGHLIYTFSPVFVHIPLMLWQLWKSLSSVRTFHFISTDTSIYQDRNASSEKPPSAKSN